jgi:precorrin-2 dehydrogenase/sirohydrochlorin ferrochelatase
LTSRERIEQLLYPAFLKIDGWKCLVVGGGKVASRKTEKLLACQAIVKVIASEAVKAIKILADEKKISLFLRRFEMTDLDDTKLVICATDDKKLNSEIAELAQKKGLLVNVVNAAEEGNFLVASSVQRGPLAIAVSTGGISPALARKIREDLEKEFGTEYELFLELMEKYREKAFQSFANEDERKKLFFELAHSKVLDEIRSGKSREKIESLMKEIFEKYLNHANR